MGWEAGTLCMGCGRVGPWGELGYACGMGGGDALHGVQEGWSEADWDTPVGWGIWVCAQSTDYGCRQWWPVSWARVGGQLRTDTVVFPLQKKSREESSGEGSGVEILANRPYSDGPGGSGQYTHKIYHVGSHIPSWFRALLPKAALQVEEESWNAYPYTRTRWATWVARGPGRGCKRGACGGGGGRGALGVGVHDWRGCVGSWILEGRSWWWEATVHWGRLVGSPLLPTV